MLTSYKLGQTSIVLRVKLRNSSVSTGAGLTGLTSASAGLIISTMADNEASATAYTVAGSTIEAVTTLGTFATPTATKCRFKEVDATNHKGIYEIQIDNSRFAVASSKSVLISISGATNLAECDVLIPLRSVDPYDGTAFGVSRIDAAVSSRMATYTNPTNLNLLSIDASGRVDVGKLAGTAQTARDIGASVLVGDKTGFSLTAGEETAIANAVGTRIVEGSLTMDHHLRIQTSALAGLSDTFPAGPVHFRDNANAKNRITATVDANGNRTVVTVDGT